MSFSLNSGTGVITQTGTNTNLSGLASISGVTVTDDDPTGQGLTIYDMGDLRLKISGTLSHDPDKELMIFHHEKSSSDNGVNEPVITITGNSTYNYGVKTNAYGKSGYSTGCGLMITGRPYSNWHPSDSGIKVDSPTAKFVCRGGVIQSTRGLYLSGNIDIEETVFLNMSDRFSMEIRTFGRNDIVTDRAQNIVLAGDISVMNAYRMSEQKIIFKSGAISRVYGAYYEAELFDFDVSKNTFDYDIGNCANNSQSIQDHHIVNSATGTDVRTMWRNTTANAAQQGNTFIHKQVKLNVKDVASTPIQDVKMYLQDNPSQYAKRVEYTTNHATDRYTTPTLSTGVVSNSDKTITYDYRDVIQYNKTTDAAGDIGTFKILTGTQFLEYTAVTQSTAASKYYHAFTSGKWRESDGKEPKYSDWDTSRFGNFYKVDRRSISNTNADDFTFYFCSYDHMLSSTTQELKGIGTLDINWTLFDDQLITQTKTQADAYTAIDTPEKFYNRAKAYLYDNYSGESDVIVTRDGNTVDAGANNVVVDALAENVFDVEPAFSELSHDIAAIKRADHTDKPTITADFTLKGQLAADVTKLEIVGNSSGPTATDFAGTVTPWTYSSGVLTYTYDSDTYIGLDKIRDDTRKLDYDFKERGTNGGYYVNSAGTGQLFDLDFTNADYHLYDIDNDFSSYSGAYTGLSPTDVTVSSETITLSADTYVGNILTSGNTTLLNGAQVIGTFGNVTVLPWEVTNVEATATLQLYNVSKTSEIENILVPGSPNTRVTASGSYNNTQVTDGDQIRLRISCQAGAAAFLPFETYGIATSVGISFKADQQPDTIYNDNAIDADALAVANEIRADYPSVQIDIADSNGFADVRDIYAFYVKQTTTPTGIDKWFGAITAIDHQNYRINVGAADIKIQNIGSGPLVITGARIFRSDGNSVLHADNGDQPMTQDNGELIQYIRGQVTESLQTQLPSAVDDAIQNNAVINELDKNTKLIPGLL